MVVSWGMVDGFHGVRGVLVVLVVLVETGSAAIDVSFAEGVLVVMHPHL